MAVPFSNTKLRVPKGFQNILEGLAREVLRSQPKEIYEFGCQYFESLLKGREETGHDPAVHGAKLEDRFYNNDTFKAPSADPSDPQQQDAALTIQTNYRQHAAKEEVQGMREEDAAVKIQAGVRGYIDRQKVLEAQDPEEFNRRQEEAKERLADHEPAAAQEEEEVDIDLTDPDVEKAAIKIQAGFKGFKARKGVQDTKSQEPEPVAEPQTEEDELADIDLNDPELASAATKIQASFRGHKTRKDVEELKAQEKEVEKETVDDELADIDLTDPDVANAAVKIQAGFRGHMARKSVQNQKTDEDAETTAATTEEKEEEEIDIDLNDPEVEKAATKIQASFKGHKARMEVKAKKENQQTEEEEPAAEEKPAEEEIDIDLEDPNTEKAAVMIQAQFRGFKTRKDIMEKKASSTEEAPQEEAAGTSDTKQEEEEVDIDLTDPEVEKAAVKIQSGFKGYKARKEMQKEDASAEGEKTEEKTEEPSEEKQAEEEEVDIDLTDPEVEKAALKIQAGFKGFKARKDVKQDEDKKEDEQ